MDFDPQQIYRSLTMTKLLPALLPSVVLLATGACAQQAPTALSELQATYGNTNLEIVALNQISVEMKVQGLGCPRIGDDVVAKFDGIAMDVSRGGESDTFDGCYPVGFSIAKMPVASAQAYEAVAQSSDLLIEDSNTTWTISSTRMFSNDFTIDAANSRVVWEDVTTISTAQLVPAVPFTLNGNAIEYAKGTDIVSVNAYAHPTPSVCSGPNACFVDLAGTRAFGPANPQ